MINAQTIRQHMAEQAEKAAQESHIVVDYYRIRRKYAVALPVTEQPFFHESIDSFDGYPWPIWFLFAYENRLAALGWAGQWEENAEYRDLCERDLQAMADWQIFRQYDKPDLCTGHSGRMMWYALHHWAWLSEKTKAALKTACATLVDQALEGLKMYDEFFDTAQELIDQDLVQGKPKLLHNIPMIGTMGAALAASCIDHPRIEELHHWVSIRVEAMLEVLPQGFSEGLAYDGYVMDFVYDWLHVVDDTRKKMVLEHPSTEGGLRQCFALGAPGDVAKCAQIGDVEAMEWPFHSSAQARLFTWIGGADRAHYLQQYNISWMRLQALGCIFEKIEEVSVSEKDKPQAGAWDADYVSVLRSGWKKTDLAVAASSSICTMGHIHFDASAILIGTEGQWLLDDAGYQQYLATSERDFTMGANSHNAPVINGEAQCIKAVKRIAFDDSDKKCMKMQFDIKECYGESLQLRSMQRSIWLINGTTVVVADAVAADADMTIRYNWHAHVDAAWSAANGACGIHGDNSTLMIRSPQLSDSDYDYSHIRRMRGSRGQQTWHPSIACGKEKVIWWIFETGNQKAAIQLSDDGRSLVIMDKTLQA